VHGFSRVISALGTGLLQGGKSAVSMKSIDFGANWTDGAALSAPLRMSVTATAVPEPGTITLFGLGVLALAGRVLRRKVV
jgi:hypothetical protein